MGLAGLVFEEEQMKKGTGMISGQGVMEVTEAGGNRESSKGRGRFDLLPYEAIEALAMWYEDGAEKYGARNWEKGLNVADSINRMIRHSIKAGNGWTDEDHLSAVMWNAACAITMMKRRPDCNDHPWMLLGEPGLNGAMILKQLESEESIALDQGGELFDAFKKYRTELLKIIDKRNS